MLRFPLSSPYIFKLVYDIKYQKNALLFGKC